MIFIIIIKSGVMLFMHTQMSSLCFSKGAKGQKGQRGDAGKGLPGHDGHQGLRGTMFFGLSFQVISEI